MNLVEAINNKFYRIAEEILKEELHEIVSSKLHESKKRIAADMSGKMYKQTERMRRLRMDVLENNKAEEPKVTQGTEQEVPECWSGYRQEGMKKKGDRMVPNCVKEEDEPGDESSMARSELSAITRDAKTIMSKIKGNKELEAWTQSKITKSADYLNAVADYMSEEELHEARIAIVKARIRGGKIQRRKKVSNVPGFTIRGGQLTRMSAAERRRRKLGARKAARKAKTKKTQMLRKRRMSLMKRQRLGI
jgi:hypothetical protein